MINLYIFFLFISRFLGLNILIYIVKFLRIFIIMDKHNLKIRLEDELIKKLILKAKDEEIAFEDYLIKTLENAVSTEH